MRNKLQSLYLNVYDKAWIAKKYKEKTEMYTKNHKRLELQKRFPLTVEQKKQIDEYYQTYYGNPLAELEKRER